MSDLREPVGRGWPPELHPERPVAVVVARQGRLPAGADEAVAEAGGWVLVVGSGAEAAAGDLVAAELAFWFETGDGLRPGALADLVHRAVQHTRLVILPASPDGRDLAPRLAAVLDRPLVAQALSVAVTPDGGVRGRVARYDDRVVVDVAVDGPAVATLVPASRSVEPAARPAGLVPTLLTPVAVEPDGSPRHHADPELVELVAPDPATMDLADAVRVVGGGAGLAAGLGDAEAGAAFDLLVGVAAALGASAGATRVATDAGWIGYDRQIGTTGVSVDPELYLALGVSGAAQHVGGLGAPRHVVSVNTDPSCPMTALADLGLVTDARALLEELARRAGVTGGAPSDVEHEGVASGG